MKKIEKFKFEMYKEGWEDKISELVWEVFKEFEAPDYSKEGIETFKKFIEPKCLKERIQNEGFKVYCCLFENKIIGVIAFRNITHISLLFVKKIYHKRGIAKELLNIALKDIKRLNTELKELTVNSSPYAFKIYDKLGFVASDNMLEKDGIKYIPMKSFIG